MVVEVGNLVIRSRLDAEDIRQNVMALKREFQSAAGEVGGLFTGITGVAKQAGLAASNFAKLGGAGVAALGGLAIAFGPSSQVAIERFGLQMEQTGRIADRVFGPALNRIANITERLIPILDSVITRYENLKSGLSVTLGPESAAGITGTAETLAIAGIGRSLLSKIPGIGGFAGKAFPPLLGAGILAGPAGQNLFSGTPPENAGQFVEQVGAGALLGSPGGLAGAAIGASLAGFFGIGKTIGQIIIQATEVKVEGGGIGPAV